MSATRVKNFDFADDASENTLSYPYIRYMTNEKLQGAEEFHFRTTFWKCIVPMPKCFERCTTKTEVCNGKSYFKKLYISL